MSLQLNKETTSFKVALLDEERHQTEVRRFGVEHEIVNEFSYLLDKLRAVFSNLGTSSLKVWWKGNYNVLYVI